MNQFKLKTILPLLIFVSLAFSSCKAIAGIFKAGVWFGVIGVIVMLLLFSGL